VEDDVKRCRWVNLANSRYVAYHDAEWGEPVFDDRRLFEMLLLESFQAGLSWECVLNKREAFRKAFDGFSAEAVAGYKVAKLELLRQDKGIIRNRLKLKAAVANAQAFLKIQAEFGSFANFIWHFTENKVVYENDRTSSPLSDAVSRELKRRGMSFVGTTIIYSFLQAVGVINSHDRDCFKHKGGA
jgi:DNA-3-methyladenine glycosylase I